MNRKLWVSFLLILCLPIVAIGVMGVRIAKDEQEMLANRQREVFQGYLKTSLSLIQRFVAETEAELTRDILSGNFDRESLRRLDRHHGLIHQSFLLTRQGNLIHPAEHWNDLSTREQQFLERTREIWAGKTLLYQKQGEKMPEQRLKIRSKTASGEPVAGWHSYYWGDGLRVLFFIRRNQQVVGAELNRMRLMAELIAELQEDAARSSTPGRIALLDARGELIFQSGGAEIKSAAAPDAVMLLPSPFDSWKVAYFQLPGEQIPGGKFIMFNMLSGGLLLGLCFVALVVFFYREQCRELREAAQRVNFVNQVSHELKTPLTSIRMYAELLEGSLDSPDEKSSRYLQVIVSESQRLSRLISNILTFARQEKDRLRLHPSSGKLAEVIENVVEQFRPGLEDKGISVELRGQAGELFVFDRDIIQQILANLISNVEKYTPEGGAVQIDCETSDGTARILVSDNGPGIPRDSRERVFEPFTRLSNRVTEGVSGTGIGLSIARNLARLHGGDLKILDSDCGTLFELTITEGPVQTVS